MEVLSGAIFVLSLYLNSASEHVLTQCCPVAPQKPMGAPQPLHSPKAPQNPAGAPWPHTLPLPCSSQKIHAVHIGDTLDQVDLTDIYRKSIQKQQNTHSCQVHMEHSPEQIIC